MCLLNKKEMNEFDSKASTWDENPVHLERSKAIAKLMREMIPLTSSMTALEFGAGTGILSILLHENAGSIVLLDNSREMVRMTENKIASMKIENLEVQFCDLENDVFPGQYDLIFSQMAMHHVGDIDAMIKKFKGMLKPGGYVAIADLYAEDGTFHDDSFTGHRGFDPDELSGTVSTQGFENQMYSQCFVIKKTMTDNSIKEYPVFLLTARKPL